MDAPYVANITREPEEDEKVIFITVLGGIQASHVVDSAPAMDIDCCAFEFVLDRRERELFGVNFVAIEAVALQVLVLSALFDYS